MQSPGTLWTVNPTSSLIEFKIRHLMLSKVKGRFLRFNGTLDWNPEAPGKTEAQSTIEVKSIDTGDDGRNRHLIGPEFFNAELHPAIRFVSRSFEFKNKNQFEVIGELEMHGVKHPVTLQGEGFSSTKKTASGLTKLTLEVKTKLRRKDFGLMWNAAIEAGGVLVGDDVDIQLTLCFEQTT